MLHGDSFPRGNQGCGGSWICWVVSTEKSWKSQRPSAPRILCAGFCVFIVVFILGAGGVCLYGQRPQDFVTRTPLEPREYLILGFMGGRDRWDDDRRGVRRLALKLRSMHLPGVHVETVENTKRGTALKLIRSAFDRNQNGVLDEQERASVRLILYGQSFGGAAVVKLARQLQKMDVPVLLTVQTDSVGWGDALIPSNVASAANLYQHDGLFIRGESAVRAEDPAKTKILGNFRFSYRDRNIDLSKVPWHKKIFRTAHAKMELDPDVWAKVEEIILSALAKQHQARLSFLSKSGSRGAKGYPNSLRAASTSATEK